MGQNASVGVALASKAQDSAVCVIEWSTQGHGEIADLTCGVGDDVVLDLSTKALPDGRVAIDAPFGWPEPFYAAIQAFRLSGEWPRDFAGQNEELPARLTDLVVSHAVDIKLSRASNERTWAVRIRCAQILAELWRRAGQVDRTGQGVAVEVHLEATLWLWGLTELAHPQNPGGYHGRSGVARRRRALLVSVVEQVTQGWLTLTPHERGAFEEDGRLLDSLLYALVARAAEAGMVRPIDDPERARTEGWIALPNGELAALGGALREFWGSPREITISSIPDGGYLTVSMPSQFALQVQERPGGPWVDFMYGLRGEWFLRGDDGAYCCTAHGGPPIWLRAISTDESGAVEHLDDGGRGKVYRYRFVDNAAAQNEIKA